MRMLMEIKIPMEPFNTAVRQATVGQKMRKILEATKPEAAYFSEHEGHRAGILIVDMKEPSEIPRRCRRRIWGRVSMIWARPGVRNRIAVGDAICHHKMS